jgi:hypothetical protein
MYLIKTKQGKPIQLNSFKDVAAKKTKMNPILLEWLLVTFFKNENYAGWRVIATKLIENGKCITTDWGTNIWNGYIGNFITTESYPKAFNCIFLKFDLDEFISADNLFFMECYHEERRKQLKELKELSNKTEIFKNLVKF